MNSCFFQKIMSIYMNSFFSKKLINILYYKLIFIELILILDNIGI